MRPRWHSRVIFGASAILYGVIALTWHDADTWQNLLALRRAPFGAMIATLLMIAQIGGGFAMFFPRTTRVAAICLIAVYSLCSLTCIRAILAAPAQYGQYPNFFEQFCLLCGALALAAASGKGARGKLFARMSRIGLGVCAVSFALTQIVYLRSTAQFVPRWALPGPMFWAIATTAAFALAAVALLLDRQARLASRLMALMVTLFGVFVWIPAVMAHPGAHSNWSELCLTFLIAGAGWLVADAI